MISPYHIHRHKSFDLGFVDVPYIDLKVKNSLRNKCSLLIGIDDSGEGAFEFDILIRPNMLRLPRPNNLQPKAQYWSGREYIILHPVFNKLKEKNNKSKIKRILLCFGGSDSERITLRVVSILKDIKTKHEVRVVIGAGLPYQKDLNQIIDGNKYFKIIKNVKNLAEEMNRADIGIISGGTLLYETCSVGLPSIVICQNEQQEIEAKLFGKEHAVICLGISKNISDDEIHEAISLLIKDFALRLNLSKTAKSLIPRDGTSKMVRDVIKLYRLQMRIRN